MQGLLRLRGPDAMPTLRAIHHSNTSFSREVKTSPGVLERIDSNIAKEKSEDLEARFFRCPCRGGVPKEQGFKPVLCQREVRRSMEVWRQVASLGMVAGAEVSVRSRHRMAAAGR